MSEETQIRVLIQDDLRTGLITENMLDSDPPSVLVSWIAWDSGFRGTDLQIGDQIIAVNGKKIIRPSEIRELQKMLQELPGGLNESQFWANSGMKDGSAVTLTVRQKRYPGEGWMIQDITGKVMAERIYSYSTGRRAMGPTGPDTLANDGFDYAWPSWYEKRIFDWTRVLDRGRFRFDTRMALKDHLEEKPRVDLLSEKYPGPFADAVRSDWEVVHSCLSGTRYILTDEALSYRELEEERVKSISALAAECWKDYLSKHDAEIIPTFPSIDPFRDDRSHVIGKLVNLGPIGPRQWLVSIGVSYLSTTESGYWYFAAVTSPAMRRLFLAINRYKRLVSPGIREDIELVGRILPDPRMMATQQGTVAGLEVEPVAALVNQAMFVDLSVLSGDDSPFAGEDSLNKLSSTLPPDNASAREVLDALIAALKANDQTTWNALYANWHFVGGEGRPIYYAFYPYPPASRDEDWIRSRRLMIGNIYDVRVVWMSEPRTILRDNEFEGAPHIEEVSAEIEHIGLFDGEYHVFNIVGINRNWTLQRRNSGPWRISSHQGI